MLPNHDCSGPVFSAGQFSPLTHTHTYNQYHLPLTAASRFAYSSHSFMIGAATTAAAEGFPAWLIKSLGRWSSDAYLTYIRYLQEVIQNYPSRLARANVTHQQSWIPVNTNSLRALQHYPHNIITLLLHKYTILSLSYSKQSQTLLPWCIHLTYITMHMCTRTLNLNICVMQLLDYMSNPTLYILPK